MRLALFKYLGIPIHYKKLLNKEWKEVDNHFQKKLGSWKDKPISYDGRLILINVVLESLVMFMFHSLKYLKRYKINKLLHM